MAAHDGSIVNTITKHIYHLRCIKTGKQQNGSERTKYEIARSADCDLNNKSRNKVIGGHEFSVISAFFRVSRGDEKNFIKFVCHFIAQQIDDNVNMYNQTVFSQAQSLFIFPLDRSRRS